MDKSIVAYFFGPPCTARNQNKTGYAEKNGDQPESVVSVQKKERGPMVGRMCERGKF